MKPYPECATCALKDQPMVPGYFPKSAKTVIVGDAPSKAEAMRKLPMVGQAGTELENALVPAGHTRGEFALTMACLCWPPGNDLAKVRSKKKKGNDLQRVRLQATRKGLVDPIRACNARLQRELKGFRQIILLGAVAVEAVLHEDAQIMNLRGFPIERSGIDNAGGRYPIRVFPTLHPAVVRKQTRWRHVFRSDIAKAFRYFSGKLHWEPPKYRTDDAAILWLCAEAKRQGRVYLDVETAGLEPLTCRLRCIGLGLDKDRVVVVPYTTIAGRALFSPAQVAVKALLQDPGVLLVGHNAGNYDRQVLEQALNIKTSKWYDTLLAHHVVESELPHSLQYCGSIYTDVHQWKAVRGGLEYESDADLYKYNAADVAVTAQAYDALKLEVRLRDQSRVLAIDHKLQDFCVQMHRVGMHLDVAAREQHRVRLQAEEDTARRELVKLYTPSFNPGSTRQMADFLFEHLKLPYALEWETEGGNRGTSMDVIRELLIHPSVLEKQQKALTWVHKFRRAQKFLGTYVEPEDELLRPHKDGRVHFNYNVAGTVSGRFSGPSMTLPSALRTMYSAAPGHVLVGADMDQVELRMCAAVAGLNKYLRVFAEKGDPHALTADLIYGEGWRTRPDADKLRSFGKRFSFGCLYGAGAATVWKVLRGTEGTDGGFPYLRTPEGKVAGDREKWLAGVPELPRYWRRAREEWRRQTFLVDPVLGRRRDFLNGEEPAELNNFQIQAGSVGVVHLATLDLLEQDRITFEFDGPGTGIIGQFHDALLIECTEARGEWVRQRMEARMNRRIKGLDVQFSATASIGHNWAEV